MDRRLKERLIGAAVLVAIGVWVIPWVLDGRQDPPAAPADPLELPAPGEVAPIRSETLRLDGGSDDVIVPAASVPEPVFTDSPEPAAATPRTEEIPVPAEDPAVLAAAPVTAAVVEVPEPAVALADPVSADAIWVLQLGAFGDAENAQRLADRVKSVGFDAEVAAFRSSGRTMHRVRVGPPATRARAEAAASALGAHGFVAQVVPVD